MTIHLVSGPVADNRPGSVRYVDLVVEFGNEALEGQGNEFFLFQSIICLGLLQRYGIDVTTRGAKDTRKRKTELALFLPFPIVAVDVIGALDFPFVRIPPV